MIEVNNLVLCRCDPCDFSIWLDVAYSSIQDPAQRLNSTVKLLYKSYTLSTIFTQKFYLVTRDLL